MRELLESTRFIAYPLLVSFVLLNVDGATLAYAAHPEPKPRGPEEAEPLHLVERARISRDRAQEASRKNASRLPAPSKVEAAEFFRFALDQLLRQVTDQFSEESKGLGPWCMPEVAQDRFRLLLEEVQKAGEPNDHITTRAYDAKNQLTKVTYPDGSSTLSEYDRAGRLVATIDERGNRTEFSYDEIGRRTSIQNPLGETARFEYDDPGNQTALVDPRGSRTEFRFDALSRLVKTIYPDGTVQSTAYDALGRKISETDQANRTTRFGYDEAGQLNSVTDALGNVTRYEYDASGNRTVIVDANGHRTEFEYDERNLLAKKAWPDGKFETYLYNSRGLLESKTDAKGQTVNFLYDEVGRLKEKSYPDGTFVRFTFTRTGQRQTVEDSRGITRYRYDLRDRMTEILYPDGRKLTFTYDAAGNRESLTAHVGGQILTTTYTYDRANRLETVIDPNGRVTRYGYDLNGNRASLAHANSTATTYEYDRQNRLTQLLTTGPSGVIQSYEYTLDPTGNRQRIAEADNTVREYQYDDLYRLTRETITNPLGPVYAKSFVYDPVGNRLNQTTTGEGAAVVDYTYDNRDRLLTENSTTYGWDDNGNLTSKSGEATYFWDFENRLVRVEKTDGTVVTHAYDADGNRVRTEVTPPTGPPQVTNFLVDTSGPLSHVVAETDASGTFLALYVRSDDLVSVVRPGQNNFYHGDGLGSTRRLTDEIANITNSYEYTAFGEPLKHVGLDLQPYTFAGEPIDRNLSFYYNRARWMDPGAARFLSIDPFAGFPADPASLQKYLYANANPVNTIDPSGQIGLAVEVGGLQFRVSLSSIAIPIAVTALCVSQFAITGAAFAAGADTTGAPGPCSIKSQREKGRMRIQIQQGKDNDIDSEVVNASTFSGVTVSEFAGGLLSLFQRSRNLVPRRLEESLKTAIIRTGIWARAQPPRGVRSSGRLTVHQEFFESYRIDTESIIGHNLRRF